MCVIETESVCVTIHVTVCVCVCVCVTAVSVCTLAMSACMCWEHSYTDRLPLSTSADISLVLMAHTAPAYGTTD